MHLVICQSGDHNIMRCPSGICHWQSFWVTKWINDIRTSVVRTLDCTVTKRSGIKSLLSHEAHCFYNPIHAYQTVGPIDYQETYLWVDMYRIGL